MKKPSIYLTLLGFSLAVFFWNCDKDGNGTEGPCIGCPIDFSLIDAEPAWSPDGEWIAFVHGDTVPGRTGIYLISPDGKKIEQWHDQYAEAPAWRSDGQWIAFSQYAKIWKKKINGDSITQLTFEGSYFFPTWSPDGQWVAFDAFIESQSAFYNIWKVQCNGENKSLINKLSTKYGANRMPHWVNNKIVYIRYLEDVFSSEIFLMDINGENAERITFNEASDYYPKYCNKTNKILFSSKPRNGLRQIWTMNADGTGPEQLTDTQAYSADWSPDGKYIVYTDSRRENGRLWIMDAGGENKRQLTFDHHFNP